MPRTTEPRFIRNETVSAYSQCPRKAFLLHCTEERGAPKEYEQLLEERSRDNRTSYLAKLQQTKTAIFSYKNGALSSGVDVLTEADFEAANVEAHCDVLVRADQCKNPHVYEPTIVVGTYRVEEQQTLKLAVAGYVLEHLQGRSPAAGYVVTFEGKCHRINFRPLFKTVGSILEHIKEWSAEHPAQPPPVILNKHCPYCQFETICRQQAEATDDLSLLDRMTPKAIRRYHDKGIFTVKQLSFLFKPRRMYRESLFRFLEEGGIPWNNNTAERAIRHLAVQRKISGMLFQRGAVAYLEMLGLAQTCRFQKKSFLKFLLSGEIDVDRLQSPKRIKISRRINGDHKAED